MPTEAGWRDGVARETATNALIGTTLGLAVVSGVLAVLTDWDGEPAAEEARVGLAPVPDGAVADLSLRF
jgi:hypothetical protein